MSWSEPQPHQKRMDRATERMRKLVTLLVYVVLVWTWNLQGTTAEEPDEPDWSDETTAFNKLNVCHRPPRTGPCKAYLRRYFYDANSNNCKVFIYGGCGGNRNNFKTKSQCIQKCQPEDACGQEVEPGQCYGSFQKYFFNETSRKCEEFIYGGCGGNLNNFGSMEECAQSCYLEGVGVSFHTRKRKAEICSLPPKTGPCKAYITSFFYNSTSMKCEVFVYGGCEGNQNNFKNMATCKKMCHMADNEATPEVAFDEDEVCHQSPEPGPCKMYEDRYFYNSTSKSCNRFVYGGCDGNQNNFKHKAKCLHRCQPREVCNQPAERGECNANIKSFFYNSTSRSCEVFRYGGCGGNQNRFRNKRQCMRTCQPLDLDLGHESPEFNHTEVCSLPPQTGPCKARLERYFYNPATSSCEVFLYGGCGGNENNFKNQGQCMKTCHTGDRHEQVFDRMEVCNQPPETGPCDAYFQNYYYDPASMNCKTFIYGGCLGNLNNFPTNVQCMQACLPNEVCKQPPEMGPCEGYFPKYFYNSTSMNCEQFVYGGCGGNQNNFDTRRACMRICHT